MSKLDQLQALRGRKSSRVITESRRESVPLATLRSNPSVPTKASLRAGVASGAREAKPKRKGSEENEMRRAERRRLSEREIREIVDGTAPKRKGRPRIEDRDKTIEAAAPWVALGMSRRTFYRRQAEKRGQK